MMTLEYDKLRKASLPELNAVYEVLKRIRDNAEQEGFHWRHTIKHDVMWVEQLMKEKVMNKYYEKEDET